MGRASRLHKQAVIEGREAPFRNDFKPSPKYRCGKCKELIVEYNVTEHLLKCQPDGAKCAKCGKKIPALEFLEHIKVCQKPVEGGKK